MRSLILRLDVAGQPIDWIPWQNAVVLYANEKIVWTAGVRNFTFNGGRNRFTGQISTLSINSIIACRGAIRKSRFDRVPPLNNRELFRRDEHTCMYCLNELPEHALTRDHVIPISRRGKNTWCNVVTACRSCNERKGARTPEEASMFLHAIPYVPNYAEWLALRNRKILADQMAFLKSRFGEKQKLF